MNDKRSGPKRRVLAALLAGALALALCACDQFDDRYDDEDFLTGKFDSYATISWWSNQGENGSCAMGIGSYTGVRTLYEFTAEQEETLCEVDSTLACTEGEAKLLVVDDEARTIAAQWTLGSGDPMTVTLPAGDYRLRIAGKSAKFEGEVTLMLDGQIQEWDGMPDEAEEVLDELTEDGNVQDALQEMQDALDELKDGELKDTLQDAKDSLTEAFGDPGAA